MKHLISIDDVTAAEIHRLFQRVDGLVDARKSRRVLDLLQGKTLAMIFQKPSTRTRISFHVAMAELGGDALMLRQDEIQLGRGETFADTARVLSRYVDGVMIRTFKQSDVEALAKFGGIPVINGLTDLEHPCQVLGDLYTIRNKFSVLEVEVDVLHTLRERFSVQKAGQESSLAWGKIKIAYVGDGNNLANSWLLAAGKLGLHLALATPREYPPDEGIVRRARELASESGANLEIGSDPKGAAQGAHVIYTDTWVSMGAEKERQERLSRFQGFQVNAELLAGADPKAIVMHCLPAHRGEEITDEVMDGPQSVVFDQAENRLHIQKGILVELMASE
ncbi:MAG: ornithine carbamoyltransferase [Nitrospinota bacterium]